MDDETQMKSSLFVQDQALDIPMGNDNHLKKTNKVSYSAYRNLKMYKTNANP